LIIRHDENIWESWSFEKKSDLIHDYVTRYGDRNARRLDYGTGEFYTSVEMHILEKIYLHPGITVTELAKLSSRTKGAISQIVKKLCEKELVTKTSQGNNEKKQSLWVTAKGKKLNKLHMQYDAEHAAEFFSKVSEYYTSEQMDAFFKIMETCFLLLDPNEDYPWTRG